MPNSLLSLFPGTGREGPTRLGELSRERWGGGEARWVRGGGRDRKDVSSSLPLPRFFLCFFFFSLAGTASDPICFQLPAEDDVSPLPVRYVLHMQKLQNILESHRCPLIPTSPPHTIRWEQSDSSSL